MAYYSDITCFKKKIAYFKKKITCFKKNIDFLLWKENTNLGRWLSSSKKSNQLMTINLLMNTPQHA